MVRVHEGVVWHCATVPLRPSITTKDVCVCVCICVTPHALSFTPHVVSSKGRPPPLTVCLYVCMCVCMYVWEGVRG